MWKELPDQITNLYRIQRTEEYVLKKKKKACECNQKKIRLKLQNKRLSVFNR